jgi:6-phosphogluconolactonase (cycloisomerase 2 family)
MSNDPVENEVVVFRRAADGSLQHAASYTTTGAGSGDGLGSQGSIVLSQNRHWLFAINAGSNELSVFEVAGETLFLVDTVPTGGVRPVSVTEYGGLVYVAHAGKAANDITGFVLRWDGKLKPLPNSTRALSALDAGPAEIAFGPGGRSLLVTEKMTNVVDEFPIDPHTATPSVSPTRVSNGETPFGFAVNRRGQVVVSEAFGGADGKSAVSSYQIAARGDGLTTVSASVPSAASAACWVVLALDDVAYVSNTKSGTVSSYRVGPNGGLSLLAADAATTGPDTKPADMAVSRDDAFLYVLEGGSASLGVLRIAADGSLEATSTLSGLPPHSAGLAAF